MQKGHQTKLEGEFILKGKPHPPSRDQKSQNAQPLETESIEPPTYPKNERKNPRHHLKEKVKIFSSFLEYPEGITFQNQEPNEEILLIIRRAFITNISWIVTSILLSLAPLIVSPFFPTIFPFVNISDTGKFVILLFYYLIIFGYILLNFSLWYFHVALVTDRRIVDIDVHNILFRHVAETSINAIVDVSYTRGGLFRGLFNYGDVFIQTEAIAANFEFDKAPNPAKIADIIGDLIQTQKK